MKIMIVDDHADMRRVLRNVVLLSIADPVEFMECDSGEDAIAQYPDFNPDCVLMDIELKSMSGFEVTKEIYGHDADAKVVMVTSYDTPTFRKKAKKLKVQGFVAKENLSDINKILSTITS